MKFDYVFPEIEDVLNVPEYGDFDGFEPADEDLRPVAEFIKKKSIHNEYIEPNRIKFLFTTKLKKDGGRYTMGSLFVRSEIEKCVDDQYDFIVVVVFPVYKNLSNEDKIIQLDKILCGIELGTLEKPTVKKKSPDSKEFTGSLSFFGTEEVHVSSEVVDLACQAINDEQKAG